MTHTIILTASIAELVTAATPTADLTVDTTRRTVAATLVTWGEQGNSSVGPTTFHPGSITVPSNVKSVKYLREHDRNLALGYATTVTATATGLDGAFHLPEVDPAIDAAWAATVNRSLIEAANGVRDSVSVGVDVHEHKIIDGVLHVYASTLREVSQVSVPAFASAVITSVTARNERPTMPDTTTDTVGTLTAANVRDIMADVLKDHAKDIEVSTGHNPGGHQQPPAAPAAGPGLDEFVGQLVAARQSGMTLTAALADITPANITTTADAVTPLNAPTYVDELWEHTETYRPIFDAFGPPRPLTWHKLVAWVWEQRPEMKDYSGNKADVPTGPFKVGPADVTIERSAGAHDFDRVFWDFGDEALIRAYLEAMTESYAEISNAKAARYLANNATAAGDAGYFDTWLDGLVQSAIEIMGNRGRPTVAVIDPSVLESVFGIKKDQAPAFFSASFNLTSPDGNEVGGIKLVVDTLRNDTTPLTSADTIIGDPRAVRLWEKNPPIKVEALNVPKGGVDIGVFGYHAHRITHAGRVRKFTVGAAPVGD